MKLAVHKNHLGGKMCAKLLSYKNGVKHDFSSDQKHDVQKLAMFYFWNIGNRC